MNDDLKTFEAVLVADPFNIKTRIEYAELLLQNDNLDSALNQSSIVLKSEPENAEALSLIERIQVIIVEKKTLSSKKLEADKELECDTLSSIPFAVVQGGKNTNDALNIVSISSAGLIRFSDIAGMIEAKKIIKRRIIDPFTNPSLFSKFKKKAGGGVLLYGPPGCGKTMLAKAIATECNASFLSVGISDILSMYKGESEQQLASVFDRARSMKPSVLFFDELDALAYSRSKASSDYTRTIVNEFLNQLDGSQTDNDKILILGATNMPWDVDDAMKRPGRFDRQVFVQPLDVAARAELLERKLMDVPKSELNYRTIAELCKYFSGADMDALIEAAKDKVLDELMDGADDRGLNQIDFFAALEEVNPSTIDWLKTARNLVKFGNAGGTYKEVEKYLRSVKMY